MRGQKFTTLTLDDLRFQCCIVLYTMHIDNDNKTLRAHRLLRLRESRRLLYNLPADVLLAVVVHHHRLAAGDKDLRLLGHQRGRVGHRHVHVLRVGLRILSFLLRLLSLLRRFLRLRLRSV